MAAEDRSPRYPSVGLQDAIGLTKRLYDKEKRTAVSAELAAKAIGFRTASGPARSRLGALKMFGLVEKAGGGLRVSDLGMKLLILPATDPKRKAALQDAAFRPALFKRYYDSHPDASDDALRAELLLHGRFTELGARQFVKAFRETINLVANGVDSGYSGGSGEEPREDMPDIQSVGAADRGAGAGAPTARSQDGVFSLSVPFAKGTISVQVRVTGDAISPAHLARVRKHLELAESEWDIGDE